MSENRGTRSSFRIAAALAAVCLLAGGVFAGEVLIFGPAADPGGDRLERAGKTGFRAGGAVEVRPIVIGRPGVAGEGEGEPSDPHSPPPSIARIWNEELLFAIRRDTPRPTVHARNLFHLSVAMWDAWAVYDKEAHGYLTTEKRHVLRPDLRLAAREEAISYAAYRLLKHRFQIGPGAEASQAEFDARMAELGYDASMTDLDGPSAAALGNRIARRVIDWGYTDHSNEAADYADYTGYFAYNPELVIELPGTTMFFPNRWQPLAFDYLVLQNGIVIGQAIQSFIGPYWGRVTPFGMLPEDEGPDHVWLDPGTPPMLGTATADQFKENARVVLRRSRDLDPDSGVILDIGPRGHHNNPLGTNDGTGYGVNPFTGEEYAPNLALLGDYGRVLAEYWADGPASETPPGHWNVIANLVADVPGFEKRIGGRGPIVDGLEWDVKVYLAMNGGMHDAAVAAWGAKGYYDYSRPISHIRYMSGLGQSSDPNLPSYHPDGWLLEDDLVELITEETAAPGGRHEHLAGENGENIGAIAIKCWRGAPEDPETEHGGVGWILGESWLPYQKSTFVTPAFAGYVSGHSTFSRNGAVVMSSITGSEWFPGGLGSYTFPAGEFLEFEYGPQQTVTLQWAKYFDAADEAGISRIYGGIHVPPDDGPGRILGSKIGRRAWARAQEFFGGPPPRRPGTQGSVRPDVSDLPEGLVPFQRN